MAAARGLLDLILTDADAGAAMVAAGGVGPLVDLLKLRGAAVCVPTAACALLAAAYDVTGGRVAIQAAGGTK